MPHHQESPTTRYFEAVRGKRVSDGVGIKPLPFVFNADLETIMINTEGDAKHLSTITTVAMLDGVDHRFVKSLQHIKDVTLRVASLAQPVGDVIADAMGGAGIARNDETFRQ